MIFSSYFEGFKDGIEFLIALGSILGLFGLLFGLIGIIFGGRLRHKFFIVFIASIVILGLCGGPSFGIKYFRVH